MNMQRSFTLHDHNFPLLTSKHANRFQSKVWSYLQFSYQVLKVFIWKLDTWFTENESNGVTVQNQTFFIKIWPIFTKSVELGYSPVETLQKEQKQCIRWPPLNQLCYAWDLLIYLHCTDVSHHTTWQGLGSQHAHVILWGLLPWEVVPAEVSD